MRGYLIGTVVFAMAAISYAVDPAAVLNLKIQTANVIATKASSVIQAKQNVIVETAKNVLAAKQNFLQKTLPQIIDFKTKQLNTALEVKKNFLKTTAEKLGHLHVISEPAEVEKAPESESTPYAPPPTLSSPQQFYDPPHPQPSYGPPPPQPSYGPPPPQPSYGPPPPQPSYGTPVIVRTDETINLTPPHPAITYVHTADAVSRSAIPINQHANIFPNHLHFATPPPPPRTWIVHGEHL